MGSKGLDLLIRTLDVRLTASAVCEIGRHVRAAGKDCGGERRLLETKPLFSAAYEGLIFHPQAKRWAALLARIRRRA